MPGSEVTFGIVGCGDIAVRSYIPRIIENESGRLTAVCDIVEERAKAAKNQGGAEEYYTNYDEMLEKADIDAVIVLTPISTHASLSIKAAEAGKHILTQKTMASKLEDAQNVVRAVRKAGVKCVVEPAPQLQSGVQKAKEIVERKIFGKVCVAYGNSSHGGAQHAEWFYTDPESGGVILDMGVYAVSTLTAVLGPAKAVMGMSAISISERPIRDRREVAGVQKDLEPRFVKAKVPDNTVTIIDFGDGTLGCVLSNFCTRGRPNLPLFGRGFDFYCEKGAFSISRGCLILNSSWIGKANEFLILVDEKPTVPSESDIAIKEGKAFELEGWLLTYESSVAGRRKRRAKSKRRDSLSHLIECIQKDTDPLPNVEWGCHVTEILLKSLESSRTGKKLNITTSF